MKKLIALVLTLCMVLTIGAAFAEDPAPAGDDAAPAATYTGNLTVSGLDNGDVVSFYHIVKWVGETTDKSDVTGWKAIAPYDTVLTTAKLTEVLLGTKNAQGKYEDPTGITPAIAGDLAALITSSSAKVGNADVTAADKKASTSTDEPGIYMALVKPIDPNTVYNPIFVSVSFSETSKDQAASDYKPADATAKKSTLTITKTADNDEDYTGDHADTTAIGDTVTYTVKATIPAYGEVYDNPHYVIKDKLTDLKFKAFSSITATGMTDADYTATPNTDGSGYTIEFKASFLKKIKTATEVTVVYTAEVTTTAAKAINQEDNEVMIEYSHDPSNENDYDVKKDTTQHYTFTLDAAGLGQYTTYEGTYTSELVKIGVDADGNPINAESDPIKSAVTETESWKGALKGAKFGLWTNKDCTGKAILEATTGDDGRMTFAGLDAGNYWLKEISAPTGFVTNSTIHPIVISATLEDVEVTEYWNGTTWVSSDSTGTLKSATYTTKILKTYSVTVDGVETAEYKFTNDKETDDNDIQWTKIAPKEKPSIFQNPKGVELPSTGGIGTTIFYILGGLLVVGAAVILVARRKAHD